MDTEKSWDKPWSTEDIIENAENWSLAGDVALLNTIKKFANNLLTNSDRLNKNIDELLHDLNKVGLQLDLSQNEFQSLKNTQFIESRVYDDDETLDSKLNDEVLEKHANELEEEMQIDINLNLEVKLLDKYFETLEISLSDSEEELEKSVILKPIDLYLERPLPPLIGSEEWYTNWYLEDEISDVDSQNTEEMYSESDDDNNLPKDVMFNSETSSEDFSHTVNESKSVAENTKKTESTISSEGSENSSYLPPKVLISNQTFAEQLTAKLDNVLNKEEKIPTEINSKPIQPIRNDALAGLFADEPPPLDDSENQTARGIFSGGNNLFDEDDYDDEDPLFGNNRKNNFPSQKIDVNKNKANNNGFISQSSKVSKGLFDSDNSDDEIVPKSQNKKSTFLQPYKSVIPLTDDEPPALNILSNEESPIKKKPIGGVSVFGPQNTEESVQKRLPKIFENSEKSSLEHSDQKVSNKILNLFEDNDEDIFAGIDTTKTTIKSNLFDDENENTSVVEISKKKKNISSLFDNDEESEKEDDLFNVPQKNREKKFNLFDDNLFVDPPMTKENTSIFNKNKIINNNSNKEEKLDVKTVENVITYNENIVTSTDLNKNIDKPVQFIDKSSIKSLSTSLFDDNDEDEEDIFANVTKEINFKLFEEPKINDDLFNIKNGVNTNISIKTTHAENTNNYLKNEIEEQFDYANKEAVSSQDVIKEGSDLKSSLVKIDNKIEDIKINSVLEESNTNPKHKSKGLFDDIIDEDDLFAGQEKLDNKDDLFKATTRKEISTKPTIAEKPYEPHVTESEQTQISPASVSSKDVEDTMDTDYNFKENTPDSNIVPVTTPISDTENKATIPKDDMPAVVLFGSTPPPDDFVWDNKSETLSDTEDFLGYQIDQTNRITSSLFDNEPPSLNENESSESTRESKNTSRMNKNDSAFYSHGSSERLSPDIFNEPQIQDNLSKLPDVTSTLHFDKDPEVGGREKMAIDFTPSGQVDDSLMDIQNTTDDIKTKMVETAEDKPSNKIGSITEMLKNQNQKDSTENRVSPGKLKQNLNINVNALLPGYSQQQIKSLSKLKSSNPTDDNTENNNLDATSSIDNKSSSSKDITRVDSDNLVGFDEPDQIEVLHCITKGRVRIPAKRRPSSRKGRQESIRKRVIEEFSSDDLLEGSGESQIVKQKDNVSDSIEARVSQEKQVFTKTNFETKKDASESTPPPLDTFLEIKSNEIKQDTKNNLFGSGSESDEDLFGTQNKKERNVIRTNKKSIPISSNSKLAPKKSLFEDSSSDDDLFLGTTSGRKSIKQAEVPKPLEKKVKPAIKKLENVETEEDPLSNLYK